jgi:molecular chaperone DnaK (HSP70)
VLCVELLRHGLSLLLQSIHTTLAVAKLQASDVTHVVAMGGGSELPCAQQAIR